MKGYRLKEDALRFCFIEIEAIVLNSRSDIRIDLIIDPGLQTHVLISSFEKAHKTTKHLHEQENKAPFHRTKRLDGLKKIAFSEQGLIVIIKYDLPQQALHGNWCIGMKAMCNDRKILDEIEVCEENRYALLATLLDQRAL